MFIIVETFLNPGEPASADYLVRPIAGQVHPSSMRVQCSKAMRHGAPVGTRFRLWVDIVDNKFGTQFLRHKASDQWERNP